MLFLDLSLFNLEYLKQFVVNDGKSYIQKGMLDMSQNSTGSFASLQQVLAGTDDF